MDVTRRTFIAGTAGAAGLGALAACGTGGDVDADPGTRPGDPEAVGPDEQVAPGEGEALVALGDVPVGGAVVLTAGGGEQVVVAQPEEGEVVAFSAVCTHQGCTVEHADGRLVCPCHDSVFDLATGEVVRGPADAPLPPFPVRLEGGEVVQA
jgi:cytochrome b6-f complex iron-sulfur subunit